MSIHEEIEPVLCEAPLDGVLRFTPRIARDSIFRNLEKEGVYRTNFIVLLGLPG
jgi:hypothetical protein